MLISQDGAAGCFIQAAMDLDQPLKFMCPLAQCALLPDV